MRIFQAGAAAILVAGTFLIGVSQAQPINAVPTQSEVRVSADPLATAFADMVSHPSDPDRALAYARIAASRGQVRVAIGALERVLRINPSLDNIRLELGSLYLASGSPEMAALYAREAIAAPTMPPDVAARGAGLLEQAERGAARSLLELSIFAGPRYDSNANGLTASNVVPIYSGAVGAFLPATLPASARGDWSAVTSVRLFHRHDLGLQREGSWETNASFFGQYFAEIPRYYDLSVLSLDTGPRIGIATVGETGVLALRPFGSLSWISFGSRSYGVIYGGGLTAELRLPPRWTGELTWQGRFGNYDNSAPRPRARDYTGFENVVSLGTSYALNAVSRLGASLVYYSAEARQAYYARSGVGVLLSASTAFQAWGQTLGLNLRGGLRSFDYEAPDPVLDPFRKRHDRRWEAGASLILPITRRVALSLDYDWFDQRSNYTLYRFSDHAVTFGLRFTL